MAFGLFVYSFCQILHILLIDQKLEDRRLKASYRIELFFLSLKEADYL